MSGRDEIIGRRSYRPDTRGSELDLYISNKLAIARYVAARIGSPGKVALELCCGIGITLGELARACRSAVGVDSDPLVLAHCRANLDDSGAPANASLVLGDVGDPDFLASLSADVVAYDIPYWEVGISRDHHGKDENPPLEQTVHAIREGISPDLVVFAPPAYPYEEALLQLGPCEYKQVFVDGRHDRNHLYFGALKKKDGTTRIEL